MRQDAIQREGPAVTATEAPVLTLRETADALGVHYMTAYRYVRRGLLQADQQAGEWRVPHASLAAFRAARRRPARPASHGRKVLDPARSSTLCSRMLAGDEAGAWDLVDAALVAGADPKAIYLGLLSPALHDVGARWERGEVTIAQEHGASGVAARLIGRLGVHCRRRGRSKGTVLLAAAPTDRHSLPTAIVADLLRLDGYRVTDLGSDLPAAEIATAAAGQDRLLAVGICATTALGRGSRAELQRAIDLVHGLVAVPVILGGAAVTSERLGARLGADAWSGSAQDAISRIDEIVGARRGAG